MYMLTCVLYIQCMCIVYTMYVYCVYKVCVLYIQCMCIVYTMFVYCVYNVIYNQWIMVYVLQYAKSRRFTLHTLHNHSILNIPYPVSSTHTEYTIMYAVCSMLSAYSIQYTEYTPCSMQYTVYIIHRTEEPTHYKIYIYVVLLLMCFGRNLHSFYYLVININ